MKISTCSLIVMASAAFSQTAAGFEGFSAICTQTGGKRYEHLHYDKSVTVDDERQESLTNRNVWKDESLFVTNPVSLRYVSGEDQVLVDERFTFTILSRDDKKLAFAQINDDANVFNMNTYLLDLESMKATYTRQRIYRGILPGIMVSQFSLDCKVSVRP